MHKLRKKLTVKKLSGTTKKQSAKKILLLLLVVLIFALLVGEITNDTLKSSNSYYKINSKSYFAAAIPILEDSNVVGQEVTSLRSSDLGHTSLTVFAAELTSLKTQGHSDISQLDTLGIGAPDTKVAAMLSSLINLRYSALLNMSQAIKVLSDATGSIPVPTIDDLVEAGKDIRSSNRVLADLNKYIRKKHLSHYSLPLTAWEAPLGVWDASPIRHWLQGLSAVASGSSGLVISDISTSPLAVKIVGLPQITATTSLPTSSTTTSSTTTSVTTTTLATSASSTTTTKLSGKRKKKTSKTNKQHSQVTGTTFIAITSSTLQIPPLQSTSVLAPTSSLVVKVVVTDQSVREANGATLSVNIQGQSPGKTSKSAPVTLNSTQIVHLPPLGSSASLYISRRFKHLHLGGLYKLSVKLSAPGFQSSSGQVKLQIASS